MGIIYSISLVATTIWITRRIEENRISQIRGSAPKIQSGPWGDLLTYDIRIEQPKEYAAFEKITPRNPLWHFQTRSLSEIRTLLLQSGLTESQATVALAPEKVSLEENGLVLQGDVPLILSLAPDVRERLYLALSENPANRLHAAPFFIPDGDPSQLFIGDKRHLSELTALVRRLMYPRNGFLYFSDMEVAYQQIPTEEARLDFYQSFTGQKAVIARLLIRSNSDIDKLVGYWAHPVPGVRTKDLKPLLEAEQRLPHGGTLSLLNFLPPLARELLFTTALPPSSDQKPPDCHWTALNFFNLKPDDRLSDVNVASQVVVENYYQVAKPSIYGDLVLLMTTKGHVTHSAVYIADDLVFTKNGINYAIPWTMMRMKDLLGTYSSVQAVQPVFYRRKDL